MAIRIRATASLANPVNQKGPMHHRAFKPTPGETMPALAFLFFLAGIGLFAWQHPNIASLLMLMVIWPRIWK